MPKIKKSMIAKTPSQNVFSAQKTADGFENLAMKLGITGPGQGGTGNGQQQNIISGGHYQFNDLTRNRIQLEAAYRGSWIVGRVVDCVAEDMTKAGIIINTTEGADKVQDLKALWSRLQIWESTADTVRWGRLYGGCIGVFQIEGQDLHSELDPETIEQGQFKGIAVYDRWQLNPVLSQVIESGPNIGLPAYYDIVLGSNLNDPGQIPGGQSQTKAGENTVSQQVGQAGSSLATNRVRVHHSRCFRMGGHKLPFFQAITEMMWDESIIERMWDRLIEFETATSGAGSLIGRANLRTISIDRLRQILAAGGEVKEGLLQQFEYMRMFQTNEGITLLDKEDTFQNYSYSFAGLADMLNQFGEQLSGSSETPLVRLFGQSPAGLGGNGETDIRNYYDSINTKQETHLRNPIELMIKVSWRSLTGKSAPKDLTFKFTPLWQMTDKERAEITTAKTNAIVSAHQDGLVSTVVAMKELKEASADTGVFTHITDEDINEAEADLPPAPDDIDPETEGGGTGDPGAGPTKPKELVKQMGVSAKDSVWKKFKRWASRDVGVKATIKEFEKGTLKTSSGKKVTSKKQALAIGYSEEGKDGKMSADQKAIRDWINQ